MEKTSKRTGIKLSALIFIVMVAVALFSTLRQQAETIEYPQAVAFFRELRVKEFTLNLNNSMLDMVLTDNANKQCQVPDIKLFISEVDADPVNGGVNYIEEYNKANPDAPMVYTFLPIQPAAWTGV